MSTLTVCPRRKFMPRPWGGVSEFPLYCFSLNVLCVLTEAIKSVQCVSYGLTDSSGSFIVCCST